MLIVDAFLPFVQRQSYSLVSVPQRWELCVASMVGRREDHLPSRALVGS